MCVSFFWGGWIGVFVLGEGWGGFHPIDRQESRQTNTYLRHQRTAQQGDTAAPHGGLGVGGDGGARHSHIYTCIYLTCATSALRNNEMPRLRTEGSGW